MKDTPEAHWNDIAEHEERFEHFASAALHEHPVPMLQLKREHTHEVLAHARALVEEERLTPEQGRAAILAALYHDVGRFPQYIRWRTFSDAQSENHARLSVLIVRRERFLDGERADMQKDILSAIILHNKYQLPSGLAPQRELVAHIVRDADKLDILRIMAEHLARPIPTGDVVLHVHDEPDKWTPALVSAVVAGQIPSYTELNYVNDFRILLGSWLYGLHFKSAKRRCIDSGNVERILAGLPDVEDLSELKMYFQHVMEKLRAGMA